MRLKLMDDWKVVDFPEGEGYMDLGGLPLKGPVRTQVSLLNDDAPAAELVLLVTPYWFSPHRGVVRGLRITV